MIDRIRKFLNLKKDSVSAVTLRVLSQKEILVELERAREAIEEDRQILDKTQQRLTSERLDPFYPVEALPQIDESFRRNQILSEFLSHEYHDWLDQTIGKLSVLESIDDIQDLEFLRAFRVELQKLDQMIKDKKQSLRRLGLRLDTAELWSLSIVRRVFGHQTDALDRLPVDAVTLFRENSEYVDL